MRFEGNSSWREAISSDWGFGNSVEGVFRFGGGKDFGEIFRCLVRIWKIRSVWRWWKKARERERPRRAGDGDAGIIFERANVN